MTDGATIQKHPLINVVLFCVPFSAMIQVGVVDASEHLASGFSKDSEYISKKNLPMIRALPNPLAVDLIIAERALW